MNVEKNFEGKNIFLTGGSGFIGKVFIEKILRTIPGDGKIYMLMRRKKGKTPHERLREIFNNSLFKQLVQTKPNVFEKVVMVEGDVCELELGINKEDRETLINNVDIIIHCAASIRFDDALTNAILSNVRSTREIIQLALEAKHLKAFIHVSTAYCNATKDMTVLDEKLYPPKGNWQEAIRLAESGEKYLLDVLTQKYIHPMPNTYTYTKSLAEHLVNDMCLGKIPAAIFRPTIVTNTNRDPIPGWTDNLNGPIGLIIAVSKGILSTLYGDLNIALDYIPVDATVNALVMTTCKEMSKRNMDTVEVYNSSRYQYHRVDFGSAGRLFENRFDEIPLQQSIWYPIFRMTKSKYKYFIQILLFHMLPALLIDTLLKLTGKKQRLVKTLKKIYVANIVLEHFMFNSWLFPNRKLRELEKELLPEEREKFGISSVIDNSDKEFVKYMKECAKTVEVELFHGKVDLTNNKQIYWRLWIIDKIVKVTAAALFTWFLIKTNALGIICRRIENYFTNL